MWAFMVVTFSSFIMFKESTPWKMSSQRGEAPTKELNDEFRSPNDETNPNTKCRMGCDDCLLGLEDFLDGLQKFVGREGFWDSARGAERAGDREHVFGGDLP